MLSRNRTWPALLCAVLAASLGAGAQTLPVPTDDISQYIDLLDFNDSGGVEYAEISMLVPGLSADLFAVVDRDGDGSLTEGDVYACMLALPEVVDEAIAVGDLDGDGALSFEEAQALVPILTAELFAEGDVNGDGVLSPADLGLEEPSDPNDPDPPVTVDGDPMGALVRIVMLGGDVDGDGVITAAEIDALIGDPSITPIVVSLLDVDGVPGIVADEVMGLMLTMTADNLLGILGAVGALPLALTFEDVQAYVPDLTQELFDEVDVDNDGLFTEADIRLIWAANPVDPPDPPDPTDPVELPLLRDLIDALFVLFDANGDGLVSMTEIEQVVGMPVPLPFVDGTVVPGDVAFSREDVYNLLAPMDPDSVIHVLASAGVPMPLFVPYDLAAALIPGLTPELFAAADVDGDGALTEADVYIIHDATLPPPPPPPPPVNLPLLWNVVDAVFIVFDLNGDGLVTLAEVEEVTGQQIPIPYTILDAGITVMPPSDMAVSPEDLYRALVDLGPEGVLAMLASVGVPMPLEATFEDVQGVIPPLTPELFGVLDIDGDGLATGVDVHMIYDTYEPPPPIELPLLWDFVDGLFILFDANGDGVITQDELAGQLGPLGISQGDFDLIAMLLPASGLTREAAYDLLAGLGPDVLLQLLDQTGLAMPLHISYDELTGYVPDVTPELFGRADVDGDGFITNEDVFMIYGATAPPPPPPPMSAPIEVLTDIAFLALDLNDDGIITYAEIQEVTGLVWIQDGVLLMPMPAPFPPDHMDWGMTYDFLASLDPGLVMMLLDLAGLTPLELTLEDVTRYVPEVNEHMFATVDVDHDGVWTEADVHTIWGGTPPPPPPAGVLEEVARFLRAHGIYMGTGELRHIELEGGFWGIVTDAGGHLDVIDLPPQLQADGARVAFAGELLRDAASFHMWGVLMDLLVLDMDADGVMPVEDLKLTLGLHPDLAALLDLNADGLVELAELEELLLRGEDTWWRLVEIGDRANADPDTGTTHLDEALSWHEVLRLVPEFPGQIFHALDKNGDGLLSFEDFFGPQWPPLPPVNDLEAVFHWLMMVSPIDGPMPIPMAIDLLVQPGGLDEVEAYELAHALDRNWDGAIFFDDFDDPGIPHPPISEGPDALIRWLLMVEGDDAAIPLPEALAMLSNSASGAPPEWLEQMVHEMDRNGDGVISAADLDNSDPNFPPLPPMYDDPEALLLWLLNTLGGGEDAVIPVEAVVPLVSVYGLNEEDTAALIAELDRNGDGMLSIEDLEQPGPPHPPHELEVILELADLDGDGVVTPEELEQALPDFPMDQFGLLDRNRDGVLSADDLPVPPPEDPNARLLHLLREADANEDGLVTWDEVLAHLPEFTPEAFAVLDRNGDGVLSRADLSSEPPAGPRELLLRLLRVADLNNDGIVTTHELARIVPELTLAEFDRIDRNKDGVLSKADLPPSNIEPAERLLELLRKADANGDGMVTVEELADVMPDITVTQFAQLDRNGDGVLSMADLADVPSDPLQALIQLLREADLDASNGVTYEELLALAPYLTEASFKQLDRNRDGVITPDDLPQPQEDPRNRFLRLLREADANGDGVVTFAELAAVLDNLNQNRFDAMDRNGDGVLTLEDVPGAPVPQDDAMRLSLLHALLTGDWIADGVLHLDEITSAFPDAPAELLASLDLDGDWILTREELLAALGLGADGMPLIEPQDVDGDGRITAADIQLAINNALGFLGRVLPADVDGNGAVDAVDVQRIVNGLLSR